MRQPPRVSDVFKYPDALAGETIPFEARVVHVADVYDALTHPRAYKPACSPAIALDFIREQRFRMFDPCVVDVFLVLPAGGDSD